MPHDLRTRPHCAKLEIVYGIYSENHGDMNQALGQYRARLLYFCRCCPQRSPPAQPTIMSTIWIMRAINTTLKDGSIWR